MTTIIILFIALAGFIGGPYVLWRLYHKNLHSKEKMWGEHCHICGKLI